MLVREPGLLSHKNHAHIIFGTSQHHLPEMNLPSRTQEFGKESTTCLRSETSNLSTISRS